MAEENSLEEIKAKFTQYLTEGQHRKTPERYAILECIFHHKGHFDAEIIHSILLEKYRVSLATVYNTFDILLNYRLIMRLNPGDKLAQYEKTFGAESLYSLVCIKCGKIKSFSDKQLRIAIQTKTFAKFDTSHHTLNIYGLCSKCKAQNNILQSK